MLDNLSPLRQTPLAELHVSRGGRLVPFAGWRLPVQFPGGIIAEVQHCRRAAALFDVSHMAQFEVFGGGEAATAALERLVPADLRELAPGRQRYTQFLNDAGGIIDDLMIGRLTDRLRLVVNASRAEADLAHLRSFLPVGVRVVPRDDLALLALQGPLAAPVLARHAPGAAALPFMGVADLTIGGIPMVVARCGYTGEDGFEIALPGAQAAAFADALMDAAGVAPAGLGARDALRLEAGLCLYGQDIDETVTPIEAGLGWSIGRRRRREGGFRGGAVVRAQLAQGPAKCLVGLRPDGRVPVRAGAALLAGEAAIGAVTSGGFSPTLLAPIALGYVRPDLAAAGTRVDAVVRDRRVACVVSALPFVAKSYASNTGAAA